MYVDHNTAGLMGGAFYLETSGGEVNVTSNLIQNNRSDGNAGAIYVSTASATAVTQVTGNTFIENSAASRGGAIYAFLHDGALYVNSNTFAENSVTGTDSFGYSASALAILAFGGTQARIISNTFADNDSTASGNVGVATSAS
jgi:hypothetical protein